MKIYQLLVFILINTPNPGLAKHAVAECLVLEDQHPIERLILIKLLTPKKQKKLFTERNKKADFNGKYDLKILQQILQHQTNDNDIDFDQQKEWSPYRNINHQARKSNTDTFDSDIIGIKNTLKSALNKFSTSVNQLQEVKPALNSQARDLVDMYFKGLDNYGNKTDSELLEHATNNLKDALRAIGSRNLKKTETKKTAPRTLQNPPTRNVPDSDANRNLQDAPQVKGSGNSDPSNIQTAMRNLQTPLFSDSAYTSPLWNMYQDPNLALPLYGRQNMQMSNDPSGLNPAQDKLTKSQYEALLSDKVKELIRMARELRPKE